MKKFTQGHGADVWWISQYRESQGQTAHVTTLQCCPPRSHAPSQSGDICSGLVHLPMSQPRGKYFQNNCSGLSEDFVASSRWQTPSGARNNVHNLELTGLNLILWEGAVCQGPWSSFCFPKGREADADIIRKSLLR